MRALRRAYGAWQQGRIWLPPLARTLGLRPDSAHRDPPQVTPHVGLGPQLSRSCQRTFKESRARLARIRRGAYAVLASTAILAPILVASVTVAGRHLHSHERLWFLPIALSALSALALIVAALSAVRCLGASGFTAPLLPPPLRSQRLVGKRVDLTHEGEMLLERAQGNRQRADRGEGPLAVAQRSLAIAILTLILAGASVLVAAAL